MFLCAVVSVRNKVFCIFRYPLMRAAGAFSKLPIISKQVFKIVIAPLGGGFGPGYFQSAGNGIGAFTAAVTIAPAKTLLFYACGFRFLADMVGCSGAMGFAKTMPARYQRNGLFVIHGHAGEGIAYIFGGHDRIRIAIRALRVYIN